jgi:hypothetical protein
MQFTDAECLVQALKTMFSNNIEQHKQAQTLYGYLNDEREEKAEIIIRRQFLSGASNDLGFKLNPESSSYDAIISDYDQGMLGDKFLPNLMTFYTAFKAKKEGWLVGKPEQNSNGTWRIPLQKPASTKNLTQSSSQFGSSTSSKNKMSKFVQVKR